MKALITDFDFPDIALERGLFAEADAMSKALKARGCKFVGSTICYAFMQATGMVDDHQRDCWRRARA